MFGPGATRANERRVLLAFALAVAPPLALLVWLSSRAAANDHAALRHVAEQGAHEVALLARDALARALREAEVGCFSAIDASRLRVSDEASRRALETALVAAQREHPLAARFFAIDETGRVIVPDPTVPYREEREERDEQDEDDAPPGPAAVEARRSIRSAYERGLENERAGRYEPALRELAAVAARDDASPLLRARASSHAARTREALKDLAGAADAWASAGKVAPAGARDERGVAIRARSALRRAELLAELGRAAEAREVARSFARALLDGRHAELVRDEWEDAFGRALRVLKDPDGDLAREQVALRARLAWVRELSRGDLGRALERALTRDPSDDVLHLSRLHDPPVVLAYRVVCPHPEASLGHIVVGFELDLDRLARDVFFPACADESFRHSTSFAVLDARGAVRAYGGGEAAPGPDGRARLSEDTISAVVPLEPPPLWSLRAFRDAAAFGADARRRLALYGGLAGLALITASAGGLFTVRSVQRSLELARLEQDFVSNVSHELKTPLTSIRMFAELLHLGRVPSEEKKKEYLEHIVSETSRLQKMIENILDFARLDAGKRPWVLAEGDVAVVVREALDLFRHGAEVRGFDLYVELPPIGSLPPVDLDRDAIVRACLNLLSNAAKYSGDSRTIRVKVLREGDDVAISIEDRGIGIDPDDMNKIFHRFYRAGDVLTRGVSGAGLGLSLVDQIVQAHGGRIRVESEKGHGSTFTLLLPIVPDYRNVPWPPPELVAAAGPAAAAVEKEPPKEGSAS